MYRHFAGSVMRRSRLLLPAVFVVALLATPALGQSHKSRRRVMAQQRPVKASRAAEQKSPPSSAMQPPKRSRKAKKSSIPLAVAGGPQPKWSIERQEVELEPVWRGGTIMCSFKIKNKGKGDLDIKAKGG